MTKKLLMNNYSENGLMPVMDGLICWLDGRDGYKGNRVYDRVGLNDFLLEGDFGDNPYCLNNNHHFFSEKILDLTNDFSISMTVNISRMGDYGILLSRKSAKSQILNDFKIGNRNNNKIGIYSPHAGGTNEGVNVTFNNAMNFTMIYKGGSVLLYDCDKKVTEFSKFKVMLKFPIQIGSYGADFANHSNFTLHSLKIYDRALNEEEIQQNYLYEQSIERG